MAKFESEKLDLDLELTTIDGDVEPLAPKIKINTTKTLELIEQWGVMEKEQAIEKKKEEKAEKEGKEYKPTGKRKNPFEIIAIELEMIYPKPAQWWMDNFDIVTLGKIMTHVAETMGGVKKKEKSSKSSSNLPKSASG